MENPKGFFSILFFIVFLMYLVFYSATVSSYPPCPPTPFASQQFFLFRARSRSPHGKKGVACSSRGEGWSVLATSQSPHPSTPSHRFAAVQTREPPDFSTGVRGTGSFKEFSHHFSVFKLNPLPQQNDSPWDRLSGPYYILKNKNKILKLLKFNRECSIVRIHDNLSVCNSFVTLTHLQPSPISPRLFITTKMRDWGAGNFSICIP